MTMTRNDSLRQMIRGVRKYTGRTAGDVMSEPIAQGLDRKDRMFFRRHRNEPYQAVALACQNGRVWPGDDSRAAQKLRYPAVRGERGPGRPPLDGAQRRERFNVTLPRDVADYLSQIGDGNRSQAIVGLARERMKRG